MRVRRCFTGLRHPPPTVRASWGSWGCGSRYCHTRSPTDGPAESPHSTSKDGPTPYEQFSADRHRYSFHSKGSRVPLGRTRMHGRCDEKAAGYGREDKEDEDGGPRPHSTKADGEEIPYGRGTAMFQERRQLSRSWENAFYSKVHYEQGMHERFRAAVEAEDADQARAAEEEAKTVHRRGVADDGNQRLRNCDSSASSGNGHAFASPWPADETAPVSEFLLLSPDFQQEYILRRLAMGERRVRYAADYGSLMMMQQLNLGEMMIREAEELLTVTGWGNAALTERIDEVKQMALQVKFNYDLI